MIFKSCLLLVMSLLAATTLAIFVVPVLFALITKLSYGKKIKRLQEENRKEEEIDQKIIDERLG